jgi:predicted Holliday junction resolvase-like endonuclease
MPMETFVMGVLATLLFVAVVLMGLIASQLRAMRREVEAARAQIAKMDWSTMLLNGVQQLKEAVRALDQIDKRLQKLEAIEKVQLSHINVRAGK